MKCISVLQKKNKKRILAKNKEIKAFCVLSAIELFSCQTFFFHITLTTKFYSFIFSPYTTNKSRKFCDVHDDDSKRQFHPKSFLFPRLLFQSSHFQAIFVLFLSYSEFYSHPPRSDLFFLFSRRKVLRFLKPHFGCSQDKHEKILKYRGCNFVNNYHTHDRGTDIHYFLFNKRVFASALMLIKSTRYTARVGVFTL